MKKVFTLLLALVLGWGVKAQCPLQTAVDFTATDVHGERVHLFDILDRGQYVLLDFFFTTCGACIESIPYMVQSHSMFGCNQHDVYYMEVDYGDSQAACLNWVNRYGVEYPTICGQSGGTTICNQYGISSFPTVILIAPDRSILIRDLWPIETTDDIVNALEAQGLHQHECGVGLTEASCPSLVGSPNPADAYLLLKGENLGTVRVYNTLGQMMDEFEANGNELNIHTSSYGNGIYVVKAGEQTLRFMVRH